MRPAVPRCASLHAELLAPLLPAAPYQSLTTCPLSTFGQQWLPCHLWHAFMAGLYVHAGKRLAARHHGKGEWIPSQLVWAGAIEVCERLPMASSGVYWKVTAAGQAYMEEHKRRWTWFDNSRKPWKDFMRLKVRSLHPNCSAKCMLPEGRLHLQQLEACCGPSGAAKALILQHAVTGSSALLQYPALLLKTARRRAKSSGVTSPPTQQEEVWRLMILACNDSCRLTRQQLVTAYPAASRNNDGHISQLVKGGRVIRTGHGQLRLTHQGLEAFLRAAV